MDHLRRNWVPLAGVLLGELLILIAFLAPGFEYASRRDWTPVEYHVGDGPPGRSRLPDRLVVMTWNLARGRGPEYPAPDLSEAQMRRILDRIVEEVARNGPDLLFLQECDHETPDSFGIAMDREIAERAFGNAAVVYGPNYDARVGAWRWRTGNAIISRFPIAESGSIRFEGYSDVRQRLVGAKKLLWARVEMPDSRVTLIDVHLNAHFRDQRETELAELVRSIPGSPSIVAGDFNAPPGELEAIRARGLVGCPPDESVRTFHSRRPDRTIDQVFAPFAPLEWHVPEVEASDHRPVVATYAE